MPEKNLNILNSELIAALNQNELKAARNIVTTLERIGIKQPEINVNIGNYFASLPNADAAIKKYKEALKVYPFQLHALKNLKTIYLKNNKPLLVFSVEANIEAINNFEIKDYYKYYLQFQKENRYEAALLLIKQGLAKFPEDKLLQKYLILSFYPLHNYEKIINYGSQFLERYEDAEINHLLATLYLQKKKYHEALYYFEKALQLKPDDLNILIKLSKLFAITCNWPGFTKVQEIIVPLLSNVKNNKEYALDVYDFFYLDIPQRLLSDINIQHGKWYADRFKRLKQKYSANKYTRPQNSKTRIGYLSPNFKNHPGGYIQYEIPGAHNKEKFEVFVYMTAQETEGDYYTDHVKKHCDNYKNIFDYSTEEACDIIYKDRIDFLIDLGGFQSYVTRPDILACRPAKKQAHYVGYANPLSKYLVDFFITDNVMVPLAHKDFFTEEILYINTNFRIGELPPAKKKFSRKDYQIDDSAFVLMAMNSVYKIDHTIFNIWMQLLNDFPACVLFLLYDNAHQVNNMKAFAAEKGIDYNKQILFIKSTANASDFVELLQLGNLYLDTPRYPVSSTGAVLVKANLAFVSICGEKIVQKGGASILTQAGRQDLIVKNFEEYYLKNKEIISIALEKNGRVLLQHDTNAGIKKDITHLPTFMEKLESEILKLLLY